MNIWIQKEIIWWNISSYFYFPDIFEFFQKCILITINEWIRGIAECREMEHNY